MSQTVRTMVAALGVGCVVLTAAAADPSGNPGRADRPNDLFALGKGGLGSLDPDMAMPEGWAGSDAVADGAAPGEDAEGDVLDGSVVQAAVGPDLSVGAVEIPDLGDDDVFAAVIPAGLGGGQIPDVTLRAYRAAAEVLAREEQGCAVDWALLAGIGRVESNHGRFGGATVTTDGVSVPAILGPRLDGSLAGTMVIRDTDGGSLDRDGAYDRAVGPMQFLPGTWQGYGSDGDRDGVSEPQDIDDAALAAARYLCAGRGGLDTVDGASSAVRRYNNSSEYVQKVLATAQGYRDGDGFTSDGFTSVGFDDGSGDPFDDGFGDYPYDAGYDDSPSGIVTPTPPAPPGWRPSSPVPAPSGTVEPTRAPTPVVTVAPTARPTPRPPTTITTPPSSTPTRSPSTPPTSTPTTPPTSTPTSTPTTPPTSTPTTTPSTPTTTPSTPTTTTSPTTSPPATTAPPSSTPEPSDPPTCEPEPTTEPSSGPTTTPLAAGAALGEASGDASEGASAGAGEDVVEPCPPPCETPTQSPAPSDAPSTPAPTCEPARSDDTASPSPTG